MRAACMVINFAPEGEIADLVYRARTVRYYELVRAGIAQAEAVRRACDEVHEYSCADLPAAPPPPQQADLFHVKHSTAHEGDAS